MLFRSDYIFRWLGSRFLATDDKASLGLIDRSAIVDGQDVPAAANPFAAGIAALTSGSGPVSADSGSAPLGSDSAPAVSRLGPANPAPTVKDDQSKATAVAPPKDELAVIATNGHGNGNAYAANGNGAAAKANGNGGGTAPITLTLGATKVSFQTQADAPSCADCGSIMVRNGSCYKCLNCGSTSGCS